MARAEASLVDPELFHRIAEAFCDRPADLRSTFVDQFPIIHDEGRESVCSLVAKDRTGSFQGKPATVMTSSTTVARLKNNYNARAALKHHICFIFFVMQNVIDQTGKTWYKQFLEDHNTPILKLAQFINYFLTERNNMTYTTLVRILTALKIKYAASPAEVKQQEEETIQSRELWNKLGNTQTLVQVTLGEFFKDKKYIKSPMTKLKAYVKTQQDNLNPKSDTKFIVLQNIAELLLSKKLGSLYKTDSNGKVILNHDTMMIVLNQLDEINPFKCTELQTDDPDVPDVGTAYQNYTFGQIDEFLNVQDGFCLSYSYMTRAIIMNRGPFVVKGRRILGNMTPLSLTTLTSKIQLYFVNHQQEYDSDIKPLLEGLNPPIQNFLIRLIEKSNPNPKPNWTVPNNIDLILRAFLNGSLNSTVKIQSLTSIFNRSHFLLFHAVAMLGYILVSDNIVAQETSSVKFIISQTCLAYFNELLNSIDNEDRITIKNIEMGKDTKVTLGSIIEDFPSRCGHGIGFSLLDWYASAYEDVVSLKDHFRRELKKVFEFPNDDPNLDSMIDDMMEVSPVFLRLPPEVERQTSFKYISAFMMDGYDPKNVLNQYIFVSAHGSQSRSSEWVCNLKFEANDTEFKITPYSSDLGIVKALQEPRRMAILTYVKSHLQDVVRIPTLLHRHRIQRYKQLCSYLTFFYKNFSEVSTSVKQAKTFNVSIAEERYVLPGYAIASPPTAWLPTKADKPFIMLESLLSIPYTINRDDKNLEILDPTRTRGNLIVPYQYAKFVGEAIGVPRSPIFKHVHLKGRDLFGLMESYFNTSLNTPCPVRSLLDSIQVEIPGHGIVTKQSAVQIERNPSVNTFSKKVANAIRVMDIVNVSSTMKNLNQSEQLQSNVQNQVYKYLEAILIAFGVTYFCLKDEIECSDTSFVTVMTEYLKKSASGPSNQILDVIDKLIEYIPTFFFADGMGSGLWRFHVGEILGEYAFLDKFDKMIGDNNKEVEVAKILFSLWKPYDETYDKTYNFEKMREANDEKWTCEVQPLVAEYRAKVATKRIYDGRCLQLQQVTAMLKSFAEFMTNTQCNLSTSYMTKDLSFNLMKVLSSNRSDNDSFTVAAIRIIDFFESLQDYAALRMAD